MNSENFLVANWSSENFHALWNIFKTTEISINILNLLNGWNILEFFESSKNFLIL